MIHLEPYTLDLPGQEFLLPDYRKAGMIATTEALLRGYERVYFAGMQNDGPWARLQHLGYQEAMAAHAGRPDTADLFFEFPQQGHQPKAQAILRAFARTIPANSAIHCRSVHLAELLWHALEAEGRSVPDEVGLTASDSTFAPSALPLLQVLFDYEAILMRALTSAVEGTDAPLRELVPPRIIEGGRESERAGA